LYVAKAFEGPTLFLGPHQRRKKHRGENGNHSNHNEQLNQIKSRKTCYRPPPIARFHIHSGISLSDHEQAISFFNSKKSTMGRYEIATSMCSTLRLRPVEFLAGERPRNPVRTRH